MIMVKLGLFSCASGSLMPASGPTVGSKYATNITKALKRIQIASLCVNHSAQMHKCTNAQTNHLRNNMPNRKTNQTQALTTLQPRILKDRGFQCHGDRDAKVYNTRVCITLATSRVCKRTYWIFIIIRGI